MTPINITLIAPHTYQLTESLTVLIRKWEISIFHDFTFDGLSKPKYMWGLMGCPFGGEDTLAGLVHDALYRSRLLSQKEADKIFHALLIQEGVAPIKAKVMYLAVRKFGAQHYGNIDTADQYRDFVKVEPLQSNPLGE